jgi:hypothetical protein
MHARPLVDGVHPLLRGDGAGDKSTGHVGTNVGACISTGHVGSSVGACMGEAISALLPKSMANMCLLWWYTFSLRRTHRPP